MVRPTARLCGKDGQGGGCELLLTAQVDILLQADGKSSVVPVFVQPESAQECLLGMNAAPLFGLTFLDSTGKPLRTTQSEPVDSSARVSLVETVTLPHRNCRFVKAKVCGQYGPGEHFLFETEKARIQLLGVGSIDSLVSIDSDGMVPLPLCNFRESVATLSEGTDIGRVQPLEEMELLPPLQPVDTSTCGTVRSESQRSAELIEALGFSECDCSPEQLQALKTLLLKYSDVFAQSLAVQMWCNI